MGKKRKTKKIAIEPDREYVTIKETANFFRVRPNKIRQWIKSGILQTEEIAVERCGKLYMKTYITRQSCRDLVYGNIINEGNGPNIINRSDE